MLDRFSDKGSLRGVLSCPRGERVHTQLGSTRSKTRDTRTYDMSELHFSFRQQRPRQFHIAYYDKLGRTSFLCATIVYSSKLFVFL